MERHRPWSRRREATPAPSPAPSRLDVLLGRIGAFASIAIAVAGVLGLFYTVLPTYKIASLDEQVSKKELELGQLQKRLDETYAQMRTFAVRNFVFRIGAKCTGLLEAPRYEEAIKAALDPKGPEAVTYRAQQPEWRKVLSANTTACFEGKSDRPNSLDYLRADDRNFLLDGLHRIVVEIEDDRAASLARAEAIPAHVQSDPNALPQETPADQFLKLQMEWAKVPPQEREHQLLQRRIDRAQHAVEIEWGNRTRGRISALEALTWPASPYQPR